MVSVRANVRNPSVRLKVAAEETESVSVVQNSANRGNCAENKMDFVWRRNHIAKAFF